MNKKGGTEGFIGKTIEFVIGLVLGWVIPSIAGFLGLVLAGLLVNSFQLVDTSNFYICRVIIGLVLEIGAICILFMMKKWVGIGSLVSIVIDFIFETVLPLYFGVE